MKRGKLKKTRQYMNFHNNSQRSRFPYYKIQPSEGDLLDLKCLSRVSQSKPFKKTRNATCARAPPRSIFKKIRQRFSCHFCCCVNPKDSQENSKNSKRKHAASPSSYVARNIQPKLKSDMGRYKNIVDGDVKIYQSNLKMHGRPNKNIDINIKNIDSNDFKSWKRLSPASLKKCFDSVRQSRKDNEILEKRQLKEKVCSKFVYELTAEEVKSLNEKGYIKMKMKVKPGMSINDLRVVVQKTTA